MKRRRILAILLTFTLLLGLVPTALAAVGTGWNDNCRANRQTDKQGNVTYGKHKWVKKSETAGKSCTSKGTAEYRCSLCGAKAVRSTKAPGHKWGSWQTTKEATCTKKGAETRKCRVCGKKETRETKILSHRWGDWTVTVEPTDFTMGTKVQTCKLCGKEKSEKFYPVPTYKKGDKGDGVKELQEKLKAAGYDCGTVDGNFGKKTEAAVKALETANGFTADGIAWPGVQKWLIPPEQEPEPVSEPEDDEDDYDWDAPENIKVYSGPSSPPLPDEAAEAYDTEANYSSEKYAYTAYSEDVDGSGLSLGDKAQIEVTVTNTGTEYLWIGYYRFFYDAELISCTPGAKGVWNDGWGHAYYLHLPGESSKWTLQIDKEITEKDIADGYLQDFGEWRAYPLKCCEENGKLTNSFPDDWPNKTYELQLVHPVFVSLGGPCLTCTASCSPKAVRTDLGKGMEGQVHIKNTGGRLLHDAEADMFLWDKDTGEYTYSKTLALDDSVFFPAGCHSVLNESWGDYEYPVTLWDLENSIDGASRIAFKGRAWTLDGEMFETELLPLEFYPYYADLWAELAETPEPQTPDGGFVKARVKVGNDGSDSFDASRTDCYTYDPATDTYHMDETYEVHGADLTWLSEGTSGEIEVWLQPTEKELQAGEIRRELTVYFYRWIRDGGRSVYAGTPKEEVIGHQDKYMWNEKRTVEIVIPLITPAPEILPVPEVTAKPAPKNSPQRDTCVRKTDGHGEYTLVYCTSHEQLSESTMRAIARAGDEPEKAVEEAIVKWREALDAEYGELLSKLGEADKASVEAERAAFTAQLETRRAALSQASAGDDKEAGLCVLEMLMRKVTEMCYESHTAPKEREDSLTNAPLAAPESGETVYPCEVFTALIPNGERIRETLCTDHRDAARRAGELIASATPETAEKAWKEVKQLWLGELDALTNARWLKADENGKALVAADRQAFGAWLTAREVVLNALYPGKPAVVQEVLAGAVRARVLDACGGR